MTAKRASGGRGIRRERTPFEWALLVVSLGATMAVVAGLVVSGLAGPRGPADLRVTVVAEAGGPAGGGRPFEVTVRNVGGTSAENVVIEITAGDVTREVTWTWWRRATRNPPPSWSPPTPRAHPTRKS